MARWRLTAKHYLNVPGTEWEYEETTNTGRRYKQRTPVPLYVDPDDSEFHNRDGDVIVAYTGSDQKGDLVFAGPPTPDMDPLDDEAERISAELRKGWEHPIESLPSTGQSILPSQSIAPVRRI